MIELQKLKLWAEDQQENAHKKELHYEKIGDYHRYLTMSSRRSAFSEMLRELNLLLLKDESKQPQPPDFANTMLGEVPQVVNDETEENSKAVEGATPVVRQNEQTKEGWSIHEDTDFYYPA